jgi:hypothetical protein
MRNGQQARRILFLVRGYRVGEPPPATRNALLAGVLTFGVMAFGGLLIAPSFTVEAVLFFILGGAVLGMTCYHVTLRRSSRFLTPEEHIYALLADYDPMDREGFEALRAKVKETGGLDWDALEAWLEKEVREYAGRSATSLTGKRRDRLNQAFTRFVAGDREEK